jgi:hypothetical protein
MFWCSSQSSTGLQNYTFSLVACGCDSSISWVHSTAYNKDVCKKLLGRIFGSKKAEVQKGGKIRKEGFHYLYFSPNILFSWRNGPPVCQGLLVIEGFAITLRHDHSRQDSSGRVISSSQRPLPANTQFSRETDIHAHRLDSNPQSQQASCRRPTP